MVNDIMPVTNNTQLLIRSILSVVKKNLISQLGNPIMDFLSYLNNLLIRLTLWDGQKGYIWTDWIELQLNYNLQRDLKAWCNHFCVLVCLLTMKLTIFRKLV